MNLPALLATFLANLPELLKLVRLIMKNIEEGRRDRRFKEDLREINRAFETRDAEALRRLFSGESPPPG